MEYTQACESQLYDIGQRSWSQTLCSFYGLRPEFLPPLQAAGTAVGPILDTYRRELGMAKDAVFVLGGADTQIALLHPPRRNRRGLRHHLAGGGGTGAAFL